MLRLIREGALRAGGGGGGGGSGFAISSDDIFLTYILLTYSPHIDISIMSGDTWPAAFYSNKIEEPQQKYNVLPKDYNHYTQTPALCFCSVPKHLGSC